MRTLDEQIDERKSLELQCFVKEHLLLERPFGCNFSVGDVVTYTNEYGVSFQRLKIIGFAKEHSYGRFIHLMMSGYWFPVRPDDIKITSSPIALLKERSLVCF